MSNQIIHDNVTYSNTDIVNTTGVGEFTSNSGKKDQINNEIFNCYKNFTINEGEPTEKTYKRNVANGNFSSVHGSDNEAKGEYDFIIGHNNKTLDYDSTYGVNMSIEGENNTVYGGTSCHIEGTDHAITKAYKCHIEGYLNKTDANISTSHIEGQGHWLKNGSAYIHIEGFQCTTDSAGHIHIEGALNHANSGTAYSHIEGYQNIMNSSSAWCHLEGNSNTISNRSNYNHIEGFSNAIDYGSNTNHLEGSSNTTQTACYVNHIEGDSNSISDHSGINHIEGSSNTISSYVEGSHIEGKGNKLTINTSRPETYGELCTHIEGVGHIVNAAHNSHISGEYNRNDKSFCVIMGGSCNSAHGHHSIIYGTGLRSDSAYQTVLGTGNLTYNNLVPSDVKSTYAVIVGNGATPTRVFTYETYSTYTRDTLIIYRDNGVDKVYKCLDSTTGEFDPTKWEEIDAEIFESVQSGLPSYVMENDKRSNAATLTWDGWLDVAGGYKVNGQPISTGGGDTANPNISDAYDSTATYSVGEYCIYNDTLYKCTTAVSAAEAFDSAKWTATTVSAELLDIISRISALETALNGYSFSDTMTQAEYDEITPEENTFYPVTES